MCRPPPAAWPAGGAARRRRGPLAAPPGGGSARRRLRPAAAHRRTEACSGTAPKRRPDPGRVPGLSAPGRIQFQVEKHFKKLLRRKLNPGIQKHIENPELCNFGFSIFFWMPGSDFRFRNFLKVFQHEVGSHKNMKMV